ncbi:MAG: response regulator [Caulobacterales bacterium]
MNEGLERLRILIVDDNQHMRAIVGAILKSAGVTHIREAAHGGQALKILKDWPADIAIVDFQMAPMDGLAFTKAVRNQETPNPYLPIIMMTGYAERQRVFEARDAGVTEFLVKPVTAKGVLDRLNAAIFKPRDFVKHDAYFGPTRRRVSGDGHVGPRRRAEDAKA